MSSQILTTKITYYEKELEKIELHHFVSGSVALFTARSPEKETDNEDAIALLPYDRESGVLVVADGLGGERAGKAAARLAIKAMDESIHRAASEELPLREAILDGIEQANHAVIDLAIGAATTLAAVEIQGDRIRPYHVGDSMILVTGQRGKVKFQAIPHSPVGYAVESGMIDEVDAVVHEERHIVSNVIGSSDMRIDIGPTIKLSQFDTIVVASDGLSDNLFTEEIQEYVRKGPLDNAANRMLVEVIKRMRKIEEGTPHKPDDLSFIIFRPVQIHSSK